MKRNIISISGIIFGLTAGLMMLYAEIFGTTIITFIEPTSQNGLSAAIRTESLITVFIRRTALLLGLLSITLSIVSFLRKEEVSYASLTLILGFSPLFVMIIDSALT